MIYLLYFIIFWLILPAILYFPAIYLLDPLISIHTLKFIYFDFFKIAPFILILGIIIYLSAFIELYKQGHGLPVSAKPPVYLVETGCYFWFRHPLYIGFQFILISLALFTGSLGFLITTGPLFLVLWVLYACIEERGLTRRHGDAYARYRKETGLIFQSMYNIARLILIPVFRIIFRLIFAGASVIPKQGGFYLVSLHRSYLDPFLVSSGIDRKVHFLTTSSMYRNSYVRLFFNSMQTIPVARYRRNVSGIYRALRILKSGGIIGLFPEGGRSWYGETACSISALKIMKKHPFPIVTAEIVDNFSYYPRYSKYPKKEKLSIIYSLYKKNEVEPERIIELLKQKEIERDMKERKYKIPMDARGVEELIFFCPSCGNLFSVKGFKSGIIKCKTCHNSWRLIRGKAIITGKGQCIGLEEIERDNIRRLNTLYMEHLDIPCRYSINFTKYREAKTTVSAKGIKIVSKDSITVTVSYSEIQSVIIEGNRKLEISFLKGKYYLILLMPSSKTLFMQYLLRLKAFSDPYKRYSGSERHKI